MYFSSQRSFISHLQQTGMGGIMSFQMTTTTTKFSRTVPRRQIQVTTCFVNILLNKIHGNLLLITELGFLIS
jgi:hypothetical protein